MNIVLIGMPASGKTSVARELKKITGAEVFDIDKLIAEKFGAVSSIFERYGEEHFRDLESREIAKISKMQNIIVSTGGGCVLRRENVQRLKERGQVIYLKASLDELYSRTAGDETRPLISGDRREKLKTLLLKRESLYEGAADFTVDVTYLTPEQTAKKIWKILGSVL